MEAATITLLIRLFVIIGAGGFLAYRFREINDLKSGFKAAAAVLIALVFVIIMWFLAEGLGEIIAAF